MKYLVAHSKFGDDSQFNTFKFFETKEEVDQFVKQTLGPSVKKVHIFERIGTQAIEQVVTFTTEQ